MTPLLVYLLKPALQYDGLAGRHGTIVVRIQQIGLGLDFVFPEYDLSDPLYHPLVS